MGEESINLSGNFSRTYTDLTEKTPGFSLDITRTYNSRDTRTNGPLGKGWSFGLQGSLKDYLTNQKKAWLPNGSALTFTFNLNGIYTANDSRATLVKQADNSFILTTKDQYSYGFSTNGWLTWMKDRSGNILTLTVNASTGKVAQITDQVGRQLTIAYNAQGYISTITDQASPTNRVVQYQYNGGDQLIRVIDPAGKNENYTYSTNGYLATIRDNDIF